MANTGKDASGSTIYLRNAFGTGVDNANAYVYSTAVYFSRNGIEQLATLDTATPANNRPLPVVFCSDGGAAATIKAGSVQAVASDTAQVFTLRPGGALENAITLATPNSKTLTFTFSSGQSLSDWQRLDGRGWTLVIPSTVTGTALRTRLRKVGANTSGFLCDSSGQPIEIILDGTDKNYGVDVTGQWAGSPGMEIAFETYISGTATAPAAIRTITIEAVI